MNRDNAIWSIERIVRRGASYLAESLYEYAPCKEENDIAEANMTIHLARAFGEREYSVFAEAQFGDDPHRRLDLLAWNPDEGILVASEFKRLYSPEKLQQVIDDAKRVREFKPVGAEIEVTRKVGLLAATTWNKKLAEWWSTKDGGNPTGHERWDSVDDNRLFDDALWGSVVLQGYDMETEVEKSDFHYLLYCLLPL